MCIHSQNSGSTWELPLADASGGTRIFVGGIEFTKCVSGVGGAELKTKMKTTDFFHFLFRMKANGGGEGRQFNWRNVPIPLCLVPPLPIVQSWGAPPDVRDGLKLMYYYCYSYWFGCLLIWYALPPNETFRRSGRSRLGL